MDSSVERRNDLEKTVDVLIGERIRARRAMMGQSQGDLSDQLGVTYQQLQKYESGKNRISASRLKRVAEVQDVPITHYFLEDNKDYAHLDENGYYEKECLKWMRIFHQTPYEMRKSMMKMAESFLTARLYEP